MIVVELVLEFEENVDWTEKEDGNESIIDAGAEFLYFRRIEACPALDSGSAPSLL